MNSIDFFLNLSPLESAFFAMIVPMLGVIKDWRSRKYAKKFFQQNDKA